MEETGEPGGSSPPRPLPSSRPQHLLSGLTRRVGSPPSPRVVNLPSGAAWGWDRGAGDNGAGGRDADVPGDGEWGGRLVPPWPGEGRAWEPSPVLGSKNHLCRANTAGFHRGEQLLALCLLKNSQVKNAATKLRLSSISAVAVKTFLRLLLQLKWK